VLIPGGRAPEVIRNDADVRRIVSHFFDNELPVGHMCYGYVRGRRVSAFPPLQPDVEAAGGEFVEGPDVLDGNMVSATGWTDLAEFSKAFLGLLDRAAVPG
jgi:protease I